MVQSHFGLILREFEPFFGCPLQPDAHNSCLIRVKGGISIQLELDPARELLVGCRLGALPMSHYRNQLIRQALKSNHASTPSAGIFGFSRRSNSLILFIKLHPDTLLPEQIPLLLTPFIAKAREWSEAISGGTLPSVESAPTQSGPAGLFGLITPKS